MIDLYLRTDTAEELRAACPFVWSVDEGYWFTTGPGFVLDVIGPVVTSPGVYDEVGEEITPPVMDNRFHANLRCTEAIAVKVPDTVRVEPNSPSRVWL